MQLAMSNTYTTVGNHRVIQVSLKKDTLRHGTPPQPPPVSRRTPLASTPPRSAPNPQSSERSVSPARPAHRTPGRPTGPARRARSRSRDGPNRTRRARPASANGDGSGDGDDQGGDGRGDGRGPSHRRRRRRGEGTAEMAAERTSLPVVPGKAGGAR